MIVAAEVTNAANDSTMFAPMVRVTEENLEGASAPPAGTFVADTGYWSVDNVTLETDAEVLITPMPATKGELEPDDPRLDERGTVLRRVELGEISVAQAAEEMGISEGWARQLFNDRRRAGAIPRSSASRCSTDSLHLTVGTATPCARSQPSPSSATSRQISAADGSPVAGSMRPRANGASSALCTTS